MAEATGSEDGRDLVIGIGNPLRRDDGVGWCLARLARRLRPAPRVLAVQQLTPELVEELAAARRVLFIDAWLPQGGAAAPARLLPIAPPTAVGQEPAGAGAGAFSHHLDPPQLLAITALLHGRTPSAWQLLLPAHALEHGEQLSPPMRRQLPAAALLLRRWCEAGAPRDATAADGHA